MYLTDLHTHSILSMDGHVPLSEMAQAAVDAGFSVLAVTDHCDLLSETGQRSLTFDWPPALAQFSETSPQFRDRLALRLGIELGEVHVSPEHARAIIAGAGSALDQVIGSIHNWREENGGGEYYHTRFNSPDICRTALDDYFTSMEDLVALPDCYDILAHIIYPLRYMHRDGHETSLKPWWDRLANILRTVVDTGHAIEINTCRGHTVAEWQDILKLYRDLGGELVTAGSDAHYPVDVGKGIHEAYALLQACGFRYVATYTHRTPDLKLI